jgi:hypothetical protein
MSELSSPALPPPGIIVSDNPQSPNTLIPATDTLTTRPTKGGVAYPFSLKVDGPEGKDVNASTLTLASVNITTPPAVDGDHVEKQLGSVIAATESVNEQVLKEERPGVERYFTAAPGAGLFSSDVQEGKERKEGVERPGMARFETAQEDLGLVGDASAKS